MILKELLQYNDIVIQCHDNPDADALASGYALYWYLHKMEKNARLIYRGRNAITKSNLKIMLEKLKIPVSYEPNYTNIPELLVTVDCQYGQKNVTYTPAQNVAVIDHHQVTVQVPELSEIRSNIGSCATILWDMIRKEGLDVIEDQLLSTALYYGLYTDTNRLSEISHPLDRDMIDSLVYNKSIITEMSNSNISLEELKITGKAILDYDYCASHRYLVIQADECDPNILGVISDFSLETVGVDICLAFYISAQEVKFSVRSCIKEIHANELAAYLAEGIGGGGGHTYKAGGTIRPEKLQLKEEDNLAAFVNTIFRERLNEYYDKYEILYARDTVLNKTGMKLYEKLPQEVGCVKITDLFPVNTIVEIRTLEGDLNVKVEDDMYLMIGIEGEVYPIKEDKLLRSYQSLNDSYSRTFEYAPQIKNVITGEKKEVLPFAKGVISTGTSRIHARPLTKAVKLFTLWDEEKYYSGDPGDYIAVREDDEHDIYVIRDRLFHQLYKEITEG